MSILSFIGKRDNKGSPISSRNASVECTPEKKTISSDPFSNPFHSRMTKLKVAEEERWDWLVNAKDLNGNSKGDEDYDPRTLYIPSKNWNDFTNFERQYWEIKHRCFNDIVFFKKGKFYELYEGDANLAASLFDLKISMRVNMRMAGVPESSGDQWAARFVSKGYNVVRVVQTENEISKSIREKGKAKKGIIEREVRDVLTPGTLIDGALVDGKDAIYTMSVKFGQNSEIGIVFTNVSTAQFWFVYILDDEKMSTLGTLLEQIKPIEIVHEKGVPIEKRNIFKIIDGVKLTALNPYKEFLSYSDTLHEIEVFDYFKKEEKKNELLSHFKDSEILGSAFGGLMWYLRSLYLDKKVISGGSFLEYNPLEKGTTLLLDHQTLKNLSILSRDGESEGCLINSLDSCKTTSGKKRLRNMICHPSRSIGEIVKRQKSIEFFVGNHDVFYQTRLLLSKIKDIERVIGRAGMGVCNLSDFMGCLESLRICSEIIYKIRTEETPERIKGLLNRFPDIEEIIEEFELMFIVEQIADKKYVYPRPGVEQEYDNICSKMESLEEQLKFCLENAKQKFKRDDITYKKIGKEAFQLEISDKIKVPADYILLSKREGFSRYWTSEIQDLAKTHMEYTEIKSNISDGFFFIVQEKFSNYADKWRECIGVIAEIDCICSLSAFSLSLGEERCLPVFEDTNTTFIDASELRYPISTEISGVLSFIPNDIKMSDGSIFLLTGPNMGGKSTLLRQVCLAIILSQIGCFIPAKSCRMSVFDQVFTRIGANDNIISGQSTFMVELSETARIVNNATSKSFVVIDELGRGTSTFDGYAIAYAVLGYLITNVKCLGLFATHYKALANDFKHNLRVKPVYMNCIVDEEVGDVIFLYKLQQGVIEKSYGINVAKMVGLSASIIEEAERAANEFIDFTDVTFRNNITKKIN
eukprot:GHVP01050139.1.p1 GENE.GHVP01050139.1~~GHVP01050139.1.p1  ORF type:complete len:936 (+),score=179.17 GHVP01050139.1:37-2808(+)